MTPEARLERTESGLAAAGEGWFVLNAREARWRHAEGRGARLDLEGETEFPQVGVNLFVLAPREAMGMYHWEADQEDFLVLSGEALLIVEGEERPQADADWGGYPVDEAAGRHGAGVERETTEADEAYAGLPEREPTRYREGWLQDNWPRA